MWNRYLDWYERASQADCPGTALVGGCGMFLLFVFGGVAFEGTYHPTWSLVGASLGGCMMVGACVWFVGHAVVGSIGCAVRNARRRRSHRSSE